jgi:hypothetical protein
VDAPRLIVGVLLILSGTLWIRTYWVYLDRWSLPDPVLWLARRHRSRRLSRRELAGLPGTSIDWVSAMEEGAERGRRMNRPLIRWGLGLMAIWIGVAALTSGVGLG